jgi:hypothetical protein
LEDANLDFDQELPDDVQLGNRERADTQQVTSAPTASDSEIDEAISEGVRENNPEAADAVLAQLEEQTGADLSTEDVQFTIRDGQIVASLTDQGEQTVVSSENPFSDVPVFGGAVQEISEARVAVDQRVRGIRRQFQEITPNEGDVFNEDTVVIGDAIQEGNAVEQDIRGATQPTRNFIVSNVPDTSDLTGLATAAAPVAAVEPTPAGEAFVGTLLGAAAVSSVADVQDFQDSPFVSNTEPEFSIPDEETGGELSPGELAQDQSEVPVSDPSVSEIEEPESQVDVGTEELPLPDNPAAAQEGDLNIPDEDIGDGEEIVIEAAQIEEQRRQEEQEDEQGSEDEDELGPPDDPFLESDRRLRDPQRQFGDPEDVSQSVDPTGDGFEAGEDIGEGVQGEEGAMDPARDDADTVEENFEQFLEEQRQRQEEAERREVVNRDDALGDVADEVPGEGLGDEADVIQEIEEVSETAQENQAVDAALRPELSGEANDDDEERIDDIGEEAAEDLIEDPLEETGETQEEQVSEQRPEQVDVGQEVSVDPVQQEEVTQEFQQPDVDIAEPGDFLDEFAEPTASEELVADPTQTGTESGDSGSRTRQPRLGPDDDDNEEDEIGIAEPGLEGVQVVEVTFEGTDTEGL